MKKILFVVIMLFVVSMAVTALPAWNPWISQWVFSVGDETFNLRFYEDETFVDLETMEIYWYDWGYDEVLIIWDDQGRDWRIQVDFGDSEYSMTGIDLDTGVEVTGITIR